MNLNFSTVRTLFRAEIRMLLRDRRALLTAVLLPLIVMPLVLAASSWTRKKREHTLETTTYRYAIPGGTEWVRALLEETRARVESQSATNAAAFTFEETFVTNAPNDLRDGRIHFFIRSDAGTRRMEIVFRGDRDDSMTGAGRMRGWLEDTRRDQQLESLVSHGFPVSPDSLAEIDEVNVASTGHVAGRTLGKFLTAFVLLLLFSGGAIVANDVLAGEKERGTLETLLTTSAGRAEIVAAKHMVILAVGVFIAAVQCVNLLVYVGFDLVPMRPGLAAALRPGTVLLLLGMFLPMAALVAGVLLLTSGYARSYKEAQLYFVPVTVVGLLPALAALLPGLPLRSAIVIVPIANIAVSCREILVGSLDWPFLAISWAITAAAAVWTTLVAARFLTREKLMTTSGSSDLPAQGDALFRRRVLLWFGLLWAMLWIVNSYMARTDIRVQLLVNLVGFFLGASLLILRRYHLSPREVFALRAPKPAVWLGLVAAIPGGLLSAAGVTRLADFFMPVSSEMLEEFQKNLIPEGMSGAQLLFFLAIMPGIFEEIVFRGVLLHGLRQRLHPVALAIVVGLIFGAFHFALFRLLPTAVLGMLFAAVTMLTGSIFPAMLWHAANNAIGVWSAQDQLPLSELQPAHYAMGAGMLATSFWIFWRNRTPYPGLRSWRKAPA